MMNEFDQSRGQPIIRVGIDTYAVPSKADCAEISRACDAFWLKRGIAPASGFEFLDFTNPKKNNSTDSQPSESTES
jgi:hypothetical protein